MRFPSLKRRLCGNPKRNALGQIGIAELNRNSLRGQVLIRRMGTASPYEVLGAIPSEIEIWEVEPALDQEVVFRRARENLKVGNWFYLDTGESFEGIPNRPLFDLLERLRSSAR
jgi:hypothetical protein